MTYKMSRSMILAYKSFFFYFGGGGFGLKQMVTLTSLKRYQEHYIKFLITKNHEILATPYYT